MQAVCLSLHVFNHNIINLAERSAVGKNKPGFIRMIVQFDCRFLSAKIVLTGIAGDNQAVSFECIDDMIPDLIDKIIALIVISRS